MAQKNMAIGLIISFFFTGLGIAYAGDLQKGLILFAVSIVLNLLSFFVSKIFAIIALILWAYALYLTYQEVNAANGV